MPQVKNKMLQARLHKRLRILGMQTFDEYSNFVFSHDGEKEIQFMIDAVSTNKTDFFREPAHFEFLTQSAIPELLKKNNTRQKTFSIWSAGCSSGEEPYTIAMVLNEYKNKSKINFNFKIVGTDISMSVLNKAEVAIYNEERIIPVPMNLRKKYLLKSKNSENKLVRIAPDIRAKVKFNQLNLMDRNFSFQNKYEIIFCRNVIIYFNKKTQENLLKKLYHHLFPGGFLFLGHSETLTNFQIPFISVAPTVYRK